MNWKNIFTTRNQVIGVLILVAAMSRLLPHPYNFTPIAAIALFGGCYIIDKRYAIALPLVVMLISDLALFMYNPSYTPDFFVYLSFLIISSLGFLLRGREQRQTIMVASLTGSMLFFLITNFGVWLFDADYAKNGAGIAECYIKAIPFFRGTIMGDLFYNLVLFGSYAIIKWRKPLLVKVQ